VLGERAGLLDAPVLGSRSEAEAGTLTVFVGGPEELVARWTPLLSVLGSPLHVGPLGSGAAAKLVANTTLVGTIGVLGEALGLAEGLGLPREKAFEVLAATPLAAQAERRRESVESGEYPPRFALYLARKDAELVVEAAREAGVDLRLTEAARSWLAEAEEAGLGDRDYSAVLARILGSS
jgi:3-hydroxyisobutyrate dehydrogenase/2-hydroxy-3-oxopropionate reductase